MRAHLGTYPAEFYYSNSRLHKCRTRNYVSTSAENGPAMAGPAGPVPAPMNIHNFLSLFITFLQIVEVLRYFVMLLTVTSKFNKGTTSSVAVYRTGCID